MSEAIKSLLHKWRKAKKAHERFKNYSTAVELQRASRELATQIRKEVRAVQ